jgi:hypothetical protein
LNGPELGNVIELRVDEIAQLFDTLDPFPFHEKDLDKDAEEYIVGWARELPRHRPIRIVIHVPPDEAARRRASEVGDALHNYFSYRAGMVQRERAELFRLGRRMMAIGIAVLALCLLGAQAIENRFAGTPVGGVLRESLLILGWVANWRPLEIFLYEWLPLARRMALYGRLAHASVEIRARAPRGPQAP